MNRGMSGTCIAAMLSFGAVAFAQTTGQSQPQPRMSGDQDQATQVTVVGCIQRESDYRQAHQQGRGGTMGTGVGAGNEFVLINASIGGSGSASTMPGTATSGTTASGTTASGTTTSGTTTTGTTASGTTASGTTAPATTGTTGAAAGAGTAYRLTGDRERELEKFVGQRVEIVGRWENANQGATTRGTTGAAGAPGTAGASEERFNSLREIDITSFRAISGSCQNP